MEFLYQINPILENAEKVIIYRFGEDQKKVFYALMQHNVAVEAFCSGGAEIRFQRLFGKKIITVEELCCNYADAYVIVSGKAVARDYRELKALGMKKLILDGSATNENGFYIDGDEA